MDKIAQLESVVFTMSHRIKELEAENKEERSKTQQLQLLQTKAEQRDQEITYTE